MASTSKSIGKNKINAIHSDVTVKHEPVSAKTAELKISPSKKVKVLKIDKSDLTLKQIPVKPTSKEPSDQNLESKDDKTAIDNVKAKRLADEKLSDKLANDRISAEKLVNEKLNAETPANKKPKAETPAN